VVKPLVKKVTHGRENPGSLHPGLRVDAKWTRRAVRIHTLSPIPYIRLEMGSKMDTPRGSNLYQYWGDGITQQIDEEMAIHAGGKRSSLGLRVEG
jgi:hypothetical protein